VVRNFANPFFLEVLGSAQQITYSRYSIDRERKHVQKMCSRWRAGNRPGRDRRVDPALAGSAPARRWYR
jgi:hypothetical protein